ncbi:unnamed protein product [Blepharisma stoltei]|uniref:acetyl-CoA C-acetyltransferase n=1 Tax=Blepharisma stoltei TaxID=1481888 RepID=A0AAU9K1J7_9CILI|nr:unnamed protein product [Blepharisma stoltei]
MHRLSLISNHLSQQPEVCIVAAGRSPIGSYKGDLSAYFATDLAAYTLKETLKKFHINPSLVQELYLGNVYPAGLGQSPAKQVAIKAGLSESCICTNVNKVCSSGMFAISSAVMTIRQGLEDVIVAGGVEIMSNVPYYQQRGSLNRGDSVLVDGLLKDGLMDARYNIHMGECAERCAEKYNVTREEMDNFSKNTHEKARKAWENGKFNNEVIPVPNLKKKGNFIEKDALKQGELNFGKLRPAFRKENGKVTAGNASSLNDGAAMVVLCSRAKAQEMGWEVLGTIMSFAHAEQNNVEFTTSPNLAVRKAVEKAGLSLGDIELFELNEAFAVVGIVNTRLLGIGEEKVNIYGGAVALGHPLGCSGARIVITLLSALRQEGKRIGVAGICNGGGGATALVLKV